MYLFKFLYLSFIIIVFASSCSPVKQFYKNEEYAKVISELDKKAIRGNLKNDEIDILQNSINITLDIERVELENSLTSGVFRYWKRGYTKLDHITLIQQVYKSYEQLNVEKIDFIDLNSWDIEFSDSLYKYHMDHYKSNYADFLKTGNKNSIITAFSNLEKIAYFNKGELNTDSLMNHFAYIGRRNIGLEFQDESLEQSKLHLLKSNIYPQGSNWSDFSDFDDPDFTAVVTLVDIKTDQHDSKKRLNYSVSEAAGNEDRRDSNGRIVSVPVYLDYFATIDEVHYTYTTNVKVKVEIYWNKEDELVSNKSFERSLYNEEFINFFVDGDQRALPQNLVLSNSTIFLESSGYYYGDLISEVFVILGEDVEEFLESF